MCGASKAGRVEYVSVLALPGFPSRPQVCSVWLCPFVGDCSGVGGCGEGVVFEDVKAATTSGERDGMDRGTVGSAQSGRLLVEVRQEGSSAVVTPAGELDHHTADLLREPLEACLAKGTSRLVVDCTRLEFCDSTGLNVLLGARLKAEAAGVAYTLRACCPSWHGSSRSREPMRSSPCTTPWTRPWRTGPEAEAVSREAGPVPPLVPRSSPSTGTHRVSHSSWRTYVPNGEVFYRSGRAGDIRTDCSVSDLAVTF